MGSGRLDNNMADEVDTQPPPPPFPTDAKRSRDRATIILAYLVVLGYFGYVTVVTLRPSTVEKEILFLVLGNLSAQFTQIVSFFFGSSASSATKDEKTPVVVKP